MDELGPGTRLGGCEIKALLGAGSMGLVFRAVQLSLGREVALKVFTPSGGDPTQVEARFLREGRIQAGLSHANLVKVHDHGQEGRWRYLVMDLVEGQSLEGLLAAEGRLSAKRAVTILRDSVEALEYLHRSGVQHRDIKPGNILIDGAHRARLTDFGLARSRDDTVLTDQKQLLGTIAFMAPEVLRGGARDEAADVYSMGVVLYCMLNGDFHHPVGPPQEFAARVMREEPRALRPELELPAWLRDLCHSMLERDPVRRPGATRILEQLRAARPTAVRRPASRTVRPGPAARGALALLILTLAAALLRTGTTPEAPGAAQSSGPPPILIPAGDPRLELLERYRSRLASSPLRIRIHRPGRQPTSVPDAFWQHRARLDGIVPSGLGGWFLLFEPGAVRTCSIRFEGPVVASPDPGAARKPRLRVNGVAVPLEAGQAGRIPPAILRTGLNHFCLDPDPGSVTQVTLALDPPPAPGQSLPRPLEKSAGPDAAFQETVASCFKTLYSGDSVGARECLMTLADRYPNKPFAMWQAARLEVIVGWNGRELDQAFNLPMVDGIPMISREFDEIGLGLAGSLDMLARSLKIQPEFGMTWRTLGEALAIAEEDGMAWEAVMYACLVRPDDPSVWCGPASLCRGLSRPTPALKARYAEALAAARAGLALRLSPYGNPLLDFEVESMEIDLVEVEGIMRNEARTPEAGGRSPASSRPPDPR